MQLGENRSSVVVFNEKFNLTVKISGTPVRDLTGGTP
jgi:hypothetical protein